LIDKFSFGTIIVDDQIYNNDIKIINGSVVPDWWRNSGHTVDVDDVHDILQAKPAILVIGKGDPGRMRVTDTLREYTENHGITLIVENTLAASKTFNRLWQEGRNVAGGFHVGC
jgi:hypothetical protein